MHDSEADGPLDEAFVASVVEHMNDDHADAVLNIARHFGSRPDIVSATLVAMNRSDLSIHGTTAMGPVALDIPLPATIRSPSDVRPLLIRMARTAREALNDH